MQTGLPSIRALIKETLQLFASNASLYLGYSAWLLIPIVISVIAYSILPLEAATIIDFLTSLLAYGVITILISVIFIRVTPKLRAREEVPEYLVQNAWALVIPFLITSILVGLIVTGGIILLVIPGLIFSVWYAFSAIIVVLEEKRVMESLKKSKELVAGRFWAIAWRYFGTAAIFTIIYSIIALLIFAVFFYFSAYFEPQEMDLFKQIEAYLMQISYEPSVALTSSLRLLDIIFIPIGLIFSTLLYLEVKKTKSVDS